MLKKSINLKVAGINVNCGSCIHHRRLPLFSNKPCAEHGVQEYAIAPGCYKPDVMGLVESTPIDFISHMSKGMASITPDTLLALAHTLAASAALTRKTGLRFGQPVYFTLGADYLSHYFKGYPVSFNEEDGTINIAAALNNAKKNTLLKLMPESILTRRVWIKKMEALVAANRIYIQRSEKERRSWIAELISYQGTIPRIKNQLKDFEYEPPTLDTAPEVLVTRARQEASKTKPAKKRPPRISGFDLKQRVAPKDDETDTTVEFTMDTGYTQEQEVDNT